MSEIKRCLIKNMKLNDIKMIYESIYIKSLDALVISDIHLGLEYVLANKGIYVPRMQYKKAMERMEKILEEISSKTLIINGDLKHEFSETSYHEYKEVSDFLSYLKRNFERIILIKGNHDNYIERVTKKFGIEVYKEFIFGDYYFTHGHRIFENYNRNYRWIIIGHEHPAITLIDDIGSKTKYKCFLVGLNVIVLPSMSYYSYGTDLNLVPKDELLSPILKEFDIYEFNTYIIEEDLILNFGKLKHLLQYTP